MASCPLPKRKYTLEIVFELYMDLKQFPGNGEKFYLFTEILEKLVKHKDEFTELHLGYSLIHAAAYFADVEMMETLVYIFDADLNMKDHEGLTPVEWYYLSGIYSPLLEKFFQLNGIETRPHEFVEPTETFFDTYFGDPNMYKSEWGCPMCFDGRSPKNKKSCKKRYYISKSFNVKSIKRKKTSFGKRRCFRKRRHSKKSPKDKNPCKKCYYTREWYLNDNLYIIGEWPPYLD